MKRPSVESGRLEVSLGDTTWPISYLWRPGRASLAPLVCLHGLGGRKEDYLPARSVEALRERSLLAFDAPGHAESGGPSDPAGPEGQPGLSVGDIVRVTEALLTHLGLERIVLAGHSLGGLAALLFARTHAARVAGFVNIEGNLGPDDCAIYSRPAVEWADRAAGPEDAFVDALCKEMRGSEAAGLTAAADELVRNVDARTFFDYCRSIVEIVDSEPLLDPFLSLEAPRLYVHGSENSGMSHLRVLEAAGVRVASVPESNHFPLSTNPAFLWDAVASFLREVDR